MAVTSSTLALEGAQADGSRWCREIHTAAGGLVIPIYYLAAPGADTAAIMAARVATINAQIAEAEAVANLAADQSPTFVNITVGAFRTRMRQALANATQQEACRLAWWLLRRIAAGDFTDAQVAAAFGITPQVWATLKAGRIQAKSDAYTALAAAGAE